MKRKKSFPRPLGDFLKGALDPLVAKLGMSQATLVLDWAEIAGERLAGLCEPARLRWPPRGPKSDPSQPTEPATLMLRVAPGFGLEIQHLAPLIIERANAHLGWRCIGKIALRQEPFEPRRKRRFTPKPIDPAALAQAQAMAADVADENLRGALTRLGAAVFTERGGRERE